MLRGAIIGFGRMGLTHFSILNNHPEVQFVAVCDSSSFMLKNVGKYTAVETFKDYRKMIDRSGLDFVIVATPTSSHAEIVKYALERDIHVFVEKPFTLSCREGQELVDLASEKKLVNQVGYVNRFNEVFVEVKKHLDAGLIGSLCHFKCELRVSTVLKETKSSWRAQKKQGGGCLYDFASHGIDLINYLIGIPDKICGSVLQSIYSAKVEDAVYSTFIYKQGFCGNLLVNWSDASCRKPDFRLEFYGSNGKLIVSQQFYKIFLRHASRLDEFDKGWNLRYVTDVEQPVRFYVRGTAFTHQLDYFIKCILDKSTENRTSFAEALLTNRIINSIIKNSEESGL